MAADDGVSHHAHQPEPERVVAGFAPAPPGGWRQDSVRGDGDMAVSRQISSGSRSRSESLLSSFINAARPQPTPLLPGKLTRRTTSSGSLATASLSRALSAIALSATSPSPLSIAHSAYQPLRSPSASPSHYSLHHNAALHPALDTLSSTLPPQDDEDDDSRQSGRERSTSPHIPRTGSSSALPIPQV
jgi:hypothetical protein